MKRERSQILNNTSDSKLVSRNSPDALARNSPVIDKIAMAAYPENSRRSGRANVRLAVKYARSKGELTASGRLIAEDLLHWAASRWPAARKALGVKFQVGSAYARLTAPRLTLTASAFASATDLDVANIATMQALQELRLSREENVNLINKVAALNVELIEIRSKNKKRSKGGVLAWTQQQKKDRT